MIEYTVLTQKGINQRVGNILYIANWSLAWSYSSLSQFTKNLCSANVSDEKADLSVDALDLALVELEERGCKRGVRRLRAVDTRIANHSVAEGNGY